MLKLIYFSVILMKMGGRCPLEHVKDEEKFLKTELENFYKRPITMDIEKMKKEFCIKICDNILC